MINQQRWQVENRKALQASLSGKQMQEYRSDQGQQGFASLRAGMMFGCYRRQDANDPEIYVAAVTAILSEYPDSVIETVTDPRTGLPSKLKWLPTVAEVKTECESHMYRVRYQEAWDKRVAEQRASSETEKQSPETQKKIGEGLAKLVEQLKAGIGPSTV